MCTVMDEMNGAIWTRECDVIATPALERSSKSRSRKRVLLADDDPDIRRLLAQSMHDAGYDVVEADNGRDVLYYIGFRMADDGLGLDLVVSDIRMPGADGLRIMSTLHTMAPDLPVILMTAFGFPETHAEALRRGARVVLDKPFEVGDFLDIMRRCLNDAHSMKHEKHRI